MKAKSILLIVLGMSFSFTIVLGLMTAMVDSPAPPRARTKKSATRNTQPRIAPPIADRKRVKPAKAPVAQSPGLKLAQSAPPPAALQKKQPESAQAAKFAVTSKEIQLAKKEIHKQIAILERDRNNMVAQLARELAGTTPVKAAAEIRELDDDTAVLVLKKMSDPPRLKVIEHLDPKQAKRLNHRIQRL
jgi:flagellar motility protein MotE (MotC chaperone)